MKVIVINKTNFNVVEIDNVSNIAYATNTITITHSGGSSSYSLDDYRISILW